MIKAFKNYFRLRRILKRLDLPKYSPRNGEKIKWRTRINIRFKYDPFTGEQTQIGCGHLSILYGKAAYDGYDYWYDRLTKQLKWIEYTHNGARRNLRSIKYLR